jgi:23S rRNA (adenine2503-C2)-methyltransferase
MVDLTPEELAAAYRLGAPYVGVQVFQWIWKGVTDFAAMTNLSAGLRARLQGCARLRTGVVTARLQDDDGNEKVQIGFNTEGTEVGTTEGTECVAVESVLLRDGERHTACLSSQSGCAMGCVFCKTGTLGLRCNLSAAEIIEQFLVLEGAAGKPLDNVVFMGMGEPLANLAAVRRAVSILGHPRGRFLSPRRITLSTAGLIDGIIDLADHGPHLRLAVSLTAADAALRASLMPVARANPLDALKEAIGYYGEKSGRRPTLEAVLLGGVNTSPALARGMAAFARDLKAHVNLIPWNPVSGIALQEPAVKECKAFLAILEAAGVSTTLRLRRGESIAGACGQLG